MIASPPVRLVWSITATAPQYVSIRYTERLAEAGIKPSVGSVGDSYDNALAETINGLYKAEFIHRPLLAQPEGCRNGHPRMGGLVQPPRPSGADWKHSPAEAEDLSPAWPRDSNK